MLMPRKPALLLSLLNLASGEDSPENRPLLFEKEGRLKVYHDLRTPVHVPSIRYNGGTVSVWTHPLARVQRNTHLHRLQQQNKDSEKKNGYR